MLNTKHIMFYANIKQMFDLFVMESLRSSITLSTLLQFYFCFCVIVMLLSYRLNSINEFHIYPCFIFTFFHTLGIRSWCYFFSWMVRVCLVVTLTFSITLQLKKKPARLKGNIQLQKNNTMADIHKLKQSEYTTIKIKIR